MLNTVSMRLQKYQYETELVGDVDQNAVDMPTVQCKNIWWWVRWSKPIIR
jgi:hypothetical protein